MGALIRLQEEACKQENAAVAIPISIILTAESIYPTMAALPDPATVRAIKREAPDDDEDGLSIVENPPKRQAVPSVHDTHSHTHTDTSQQTNGTASSHEPPAFTQDQLHGKSFGELVQVILQLQASHSDQIAQLRGEYTTLSDQVDKLKNTLAAFLTANITALQEISQVPGHIPRVPRAMPEQAPRAAPQPQPQHSFSTSSRHSFRSGSVSSAANASQREGLDTTATGPNPPVTLSTPGPSSKHDHIITRLEPTLSPSPSFNTPVSAVHTSFSTIDHAPSSSAQQTLPAVTQPTGDGPPVVECTNFNTVKEIWQEYRYGVPEQPAPIETLDATWGPRWRPEAKIRTWYSRRKLVYDKIKELIADGIDEATAVQEVESMRRGRTINWLMRLLQEDRKETRANWKAAAAAATAAAQAVHSRPAALESATPTIVPPGSFQHSAF